MPRFEFKEENIRKNDWDYPRFKLEKGETARVVLLEDPWGEYVHTIRKPKLEGGQPVMEQKKRRDGTPYETYEEVFVSQTLCTGDPGILKEDGSDPKGCLLCAEAVRSDKFYAPKMRYAVHVVKYDTDKDGNVKDKPFGATTEVWGFTENVFGELYALKKEWDDLTQHDLIIHRPENTAMAGNYKIGVSKKAAWLEDDKRKQHVKELMAPENLAPDLAVFCGTRKSDTKTGFDIEVINEAWAIATGGPAQSRHDTAISEVGTSLGLSDSMNALLDSGKDADGWAKPDATEPATSLADLGIETPASSDDDGDEDAEIKKLLGIG